MRYQSLFFSLALSALLLGCPQNQKLPGESDPSSHTVKTAPSAPVSEPVTEPTLAEPMVNTLRWKTASEVNVFGFEVFRAVSEEGPFASLQTDPLPGHGTTDEPHAYVFVDDTIEPGQGYWYWVEEITLSGTRSKITPKPWYAKPKGEPVAETSEVPGEALESEPETNSEE